MLHNLQEVLNICANLLMDDSTPHLKLDAVYPSLAAVSDDARTLVADANQSAFKIDIPRYGSGVLSLLSQERVRRWATVATVNACQFMRCSMRKRSFAYRR